MTTVVAPPSTAAPSLPLSKSSPKTLSSPPPRYAVAPQPRTVPTPTMPSANGGSVTPSASANNTPVIPASASAKQQPARPSSRNNVSPDAANKSPPSGKPSPETNSSRPAPQVRVKKEPASPNISTRPRPRRLDLSSSGSAARGPQTAGAALSKESSGLAIKDLGVACLSPGFQTQDPTLREQLQRSLSVRDQQRQLIEARQKGSTKPITSQDAVVDGARQNGVDAGPPSARKRGPPPGLSIHAPSAASFAHERVIQSAPLHQSFTGLRSHNVHAPPPRPGAQDGPAAQPSNRLPSISDVFNRDRMEAPPSASFRPAVPPPMPSPGHPPPMHSPGFAPGQHPHHASHHEQPSTSRSREFRSAEEAVHGMAAGREELLPKIVHYGGAQPPTPPSPGGHHHPQHREYGSAHPASHSMHHHPPHTAHPGHGGHYESRPDLSRHASMSGRRRPRDEYERDHGSPNIHPSEFKRYARDREEEDWRHGMSSREKKEEFIRLCERAWDLFHS